MTTDERDGSWPQDLTGQLQAIHTELKAHAKSEPRVSVNHGEDNDVVARDTRPSPTASKGSFRCQVLEGQLVVTRMRDHRWTADPLTPAYMEQCPLDPRADAVRFLKREFDDWVRQELD